MESTFFVTIFSYRMHPPRRSTARAAAAAAASDRRSGASGALNKSDVGATGKEEISLPVESSFGCLFCSRRYNVADSLRKHMKNVHASSAATCKVCFEVFR